MAINEKEVKGTAEFIGELRMAPLRINGVMDKILKQQRLLDEAKETLHDKEASLLTTDLINGKNEQIRNAQLRMETEIERRDVYENSVVLAELKAQYELERDRFSALKAIAYTLRED